MGFKTKTVTIAEIFADNLRRECQRFASIAEFCRKARINRQQFNRYLAGQNLPNPASLQKISAALGIPEASLFESRSEGPAPGSAPGAPLPEALGRLLPQLPPQALTALSQAASTVFGQSDGKGIMPAGVYLAYMPLAGFPGRIVCAALKVSHLPGLSVFTRRTSFRTPREKHPEYTVGKHLGVALGDSVATTLIGMNKIYPHELSVMRLLHSPANVSAPQLGLSVVRSPIGELACKVVFIALGHGIAAERRALSQIGVVKRDDAHLPAQVRQHIANEVLPDAQLHDYVAVNEVLQVHQHLTAKLSALG